MSIKTDVRGPSPHCLPLSCPNHVLPVLPVRNPFCVSCVTPKIQNFPSRVSCSVLQWVASRHREFPCVTATCASVLKWVAVCCSVLRLQWIALWCSVYAAPYFWGELMTIATLYGFHSVENVLQWFAMHCSELQCVAVSCNVLQWNSNTIATLYMFHSVENVLQWVAMRCSELQRVAVYCNVLQWVAMCCSEILIPLPPSTGFRVLQMCCSDLQCVAVSCNALQCIAMCCSELQCVAVSCNALQCIAMCCSELQCVVAS
jgi:hypothetical protein